MPDLNWQVHRARARPRRTVTVLALIAGFLVMTALYFGPLMVLLAAVVFFAALNTYFLPIRYTFTDSEVAIDKRLFRTRYEWRQFRRWFRTTGGVVLSPFTHPSFLDNFRGVHLLLPDDPAPVIAWLEQRFAPPPPDNRLRLDDAGPDQPRALTSAGPADNMDAKESP
jgi:hypothetical protein